jgi:phosphatidylserine/phosphatidylglycerophosphate/cardiolipin synthase-like enzyme
MGRLRHLGLALCFLPFLGHSGLGATQAFFTSQESVEDEMVWLIEHSHSSIEMALYEWRSPRLVSAITEAQRRGLTVHVVLDASRRSQDLSAGEVRWLGGKNAGEHGIMHHKFILFDQKKVVTGSFNWTPGAEHSNYENALLIDDPETVKAYAQEFDTLWRRASEGPPPTGISRGTNTLGRRSTNEHHRQPWLKCIRIRVFQNVRKCGRKSHTYRP